MAGLGWPLQTYKCANTASKYITNKFIDFNSMYQTSKIEYKKMPLLITENGEPDGSNMVVGQFVDMQLQILIDVTALA